MTTFLDLMNSFEHPEFEAGCFLVLGRHGEKYLTARPVEAWELWAETNGYNNWESFAEDFEDEIEWSDNGRKGFLDEGGSIEYLPIQGYYRDGKDNL